jgi:hypothetical protein
MGVIASKIIGGTAILRNWECGTFDLLQASDPGNGWVEISRDCDAWPKSRWTLYPYASGNNGQGQSAPPLGNLEVTFRKYFPNETDDTISELDFSDINEARLPASMCTKFRLYQNGKKLPCEAYSTDYGTTIITILEAWRVPGAAYEGEFDAF